MRLRSLVTGLFATIVAVFAAVALALPASAGSVVSTAYTCFVPGGGANLCTGGVYTVPTLSGYQVYQNGTAAFNDVRTTFTLPVGSRSNAAIYLQENATTGGATVELALVQAPPYGNGACPGKWQVEAGHASSVTPGPLALTALTDTPGLGPKICVSAGQPFYLDIYYSTLHKRISYIGGTEPGNQFGSSVYVGTHRFHSPAIGVHYTAPTLPPSTLQQASWTRAGLTELLQPWLSAGATNGRITFKAENLQKVDALENNGSATPAAGNNIFLSPSSLGVGSAGSITAVP
jgi:predicted RecA/RadA family phage recombinase